MELTELRRSCLNGESKVGRLVWTEAPSDIDGTPAYTTTDSVGGRVPTSSRPTTRAAFSSQRSLESSSSSAGASRSGINRALLRDNSWIGKGSFCLSLLSTSSLQESNDDVIAIATGRGAGNIALVSSEEYDSVENGSEEHLTFTASTATNATAGSSAVRLSESTPETRSDERSGTALLLWPWSSAVAFDPENDHALDMEALWLVSSLTEKQASPASLKSVLLPTTSSSSVLRSCGCCV